MTDFFDYRALNSAITRIAIASKIIDDVPYLGLDSDFRRECSELWDRMDLLKSRMVRRKDEMTAELEKRMKEEEE